MAENIKCLGDNTDKISNIYRVLEARAGIEPAYTNLQSAASPFCHRANQVGIAEELRQD